MITKVKFACDSFALVGDTELITGLAGAIFAFVTFLRALALVSKTNKTIFPLWLILLISVVIVYSLCGFLSGIGALILAGRTDSGYPNAGLQSELDAIAACIIGGASFFGGRGTVLGVFAGVMIMGILRNGLNLMDVSSFWQQVLIGSIIVLAVYIDVLRRDLGTRK